MSKVVFPVTMSIIFPLRDGMQYKLYKYATYYQQDGVHFIKNNLDVGNYEYFFLFNGKDYVNDYDVYIRTMAVGYDRGSPLSISGMKMIPYLKTALLLFLVLTSILYV